MDKKEYHSRILIDKRENISIEGVSSVLSFESDFIYLDTVDGRLEITGNDLIILDLSKSTGAIEIKGNINSVEFSIKKKRGFWS